MRRRLLSVVTVLVGSLWLTGMGHPGTALAQADDDAADTAAPAAETPARPARPATRAPTPARTRAETPASPVATSPATPAVTPSGKPAITAAEVRPPANLLVDCGKAPAGAVTKLPDDLARWATVYCTKLGHIFNADDRHFGAFRDSGLRASFNAADLSGKTGEPGNDAYFTKVAYRQLTPAEQDALIAVDPSVKRVLTGHALWRLDLTAVGGQTLSFIAIDPTADLFWVFPMNEQGSIGTPAFYVTSLEALNKAR